MTPDTRLLRTEATLQPRKKIQRVGHAALSIIALIALIPGMSKAQASNRADCYLTGIATATGEQITPGYDNRAIAQAIVPCTAWHLVYYASQAATVGIQIMYAPDLGGALGPGSFSAATPVSGATPLTSITGAGHTSYTFSPWVNVNVTALTGTGAAIHWQLLGWRPGPNNDVAASPTGASVFCPNTIAFPTVASTTTQVVAAVIGQRIYVCSFSLNPTTVTAGSVSLIYGTGTNCATSPTGLTGNFTLPASSVVILSPSLSSSGPLVVPLGNALCVSATAASTQGFITYTQF